MRSSGFLVTGRVRGLVTEEGTKSSSEICLVTGASVGEWMKLSIDVLCTVSIKIISAEN